jgi:hypothetical protein
MTINADRQTKGGDVDKLLTPEEIAFAKDQYARKGGTWPRVVGLTEDAVNVATSSNLVAKSPRHLALEAEFAAAEARLKVAMDLVFWQEHEHATTKGGDPYATVGGWAAPANVDRTEAEAALNLVRTRLNVEQGKYRRAQRYALAGIPMPKSLLDEIADGVKSVLRRD